MLEKNPVSYVISQDLLIQVGAFKTTNKKRKRGRSQLRKKTRQVRLRK